MIAPLDVEPKQPNPSAEKAVTDLLARGQLFRQHAVTVDDEADPAPIVEPERVEIDDVFSAGSTVACKATFRGSYIGVLRCPIRFLVQQWPCTSWDSSPCTITVLLRGTWCDHGAPLVEHSSAAADQTTD